MTNISLNDRLSRSFDVATSVLADSLYIVRGNDAFEFGAVEAHIWKNCAGEATVREIVDSVVSEFTVSPVVAATDVHEFLQAMLDENLLEKN